MRHVEKNMFGSIRSIHTIYQRHTVLNASSVRSISSTSPRHLPIEAFGYLFGSKNIFQTKPKSSSHTDPKIAMEPSRLPSRESRIQKDLVTNKSLGDLRCRGTLQMISNNPIHSNTTSSADTSTATSEYIKHFSPLDPTTETVRLVSGTVLDTVSQQNKDETIVSSHSLVAHNAATVSTSTATTNNVSTSTGDNVNTTNCLSPSCHHSSENEANDESSTASLHASDRSELNSQGYTRKIETEEPDGRSLNITYTNQYQVANKWIEEHILSDVEATTIGFDLEWDSVPGRRTALLRGCGLNKHSFSAQVDVIQLAMKQEVLVFHLTRASQDSSLTSNVSEKLPQSGLFVPKLLYQLFLSDKYVFVGVGIDTDRARLMNIGFPPIQIKDVNSGLRNSHVISAKSIPGLGRLSSILFNADWKTKGAARSAWSRFPLYNSQITYAAKDAYYSRESYLHINSPTFHADKFYQLHLRPSFAASSGTAIKFSHAIEGSSFNYLLSSSFLYTDEKSGKRIPQMPEILPTNYIQVNQPYILDVLDEPSLDKQSSSTWQDSKPIEHANVFRVNLDLDDASDSENDKKSSPMRMIC